MTDVIDFTSGDDQSLLLLLGQCEQGRELLLAQIQKDLEAMSEIVLPLTVVSFRVLNEATQAGWTPQHLDIASMAVASPKANLARLERLIASYRSILAADTAGNVPAPSSEKSNGCTVFARAFTVRLGYPD